METNQQLTPAEKLLDDLIKFVTSVAYDNFLFDSEKENLAVFATEMFALGVEAGKVEGFNEGVKTERVRIIKGL